MPLGLREILLLVRAKDQASRVLQQVGGSLKGLSKDEREARQTQIEQGKRLMGLGAGLIGVGVGIAGVGVAGVRFFNSATDAAMAYNQQVALTLTQTDKTKVSFKELSDIGLDIAKRYPVAFDSIQKSLYDIFSSIDVTVPQARKLLDAFAKAAVGGQVDIQTAGRLTLGVLNAFKIPVGDVNKIMDVQFQMVRKGVGTYAEFASVLGRAIPATAKAGQNFQTLAGAEAFLTRQSQSPAMAATAIARAMDALSNVKAANNLKKIGVAVADAKGHFRPLIDIISDLHDKLKNLSPKGQSDALQTLFKGGGGTIQAMRFLIPAIKNFGLLKEMISDMQKSGGASMQAFATMMKQPQSQAELLKNKWKALKVTIGNDLIPIKMKLLRTINKLMDAWDKLSPKTQKFIVKLLFFGSIAAIVIGAIVAIVGVVFLFVGALDVLGIGLATVALVAGGIIVAIVAIIAIVIVVIKYHKQLAAIAKQVWSDIKQWAGDALSFLAAAWATARDAVVAAWETVYRDVLEPFGEWFQQHVTPVLKAFVQLVQAIWMRVSQIFRYQVGVMKALLRVLFAAWKLIWPQMLATARVFFAVFKAILTVFIAIIKVMWKPFWHFIWDVVKIAWTLIRTTIEAALKIIKGIFEFFTGLLTLNWSKTWQGIKDILSGIWNLIFGILKAGWNLMWSWIKQSLRTLVNLFRKLPSTILHALGNLGHTLWNAGVQLIKGLIDGIKSMAGAIPKAIGSLLPGPLKSVASHIPGHQLFGLAKGGMLRANQWAFVGEQGAELLRTLPGGGVQVFSNTRTRGMVRGGSNGNVIHIHPGAVQMDFTGASIDSASIGDVERIVNDAFDSLARKLG